MLADNFISQRLPTVLDHFPFCLRTVSAAPRNASARASLVRRPFIVLIGPRRSSDIVFSISWLPLAAGYTYLSPMTGRNVRAATEKRLSWMYKRARLAIHI